MARYTSEEKEQMRFHVRQCIQSGKTVKAYCKEHSIKEHVYHYWKHRFAKVENATGTFVPIPISTTNSTYGMKVIFPSGIEIRFKNLVSVDYIKALCCI